MKAAHTFAELLQEGAIKENIDKERFWVTFDELKKDGVITEDVIIQTGFSTWATIFVIGTLMVVRIPMLMYIIRSLKSIIAYCPLQLK